MKFINNILACIALGSLSLLTPSCSDYLEREDDGKLQEEEVFSRYTKVNELVTQLYTDMYLNSLGFNTIYSHNIGTVCDELEANKADADAPYKILNGELSADPTSIGNIYGGSGFGWWWTFYQSIRKANKIIWGVDEYNTPDHPSTPGLLSKRIGETYFFRAYYHYLILRWHGEMVYSDRLYSLNEDPSTYAVRESVHTSVEKICNDLDEAASRLPVRQEGEEFNRIDKGACLALKAIVRWIAAQPLYNGGLRDAEGNPTGISPLGDNDTRVGAQEYKEYKPERWQNALKAAEEFMEIVDMGRYSLYKQYSETEFVSNSGDKVYKRLEEMFRDNTFYNNESILTLLNSKDTRWIQDNIPESYGSGQTRNQPTQEQVDQYEVIDGDYGRDIYTASNYDDKNPYVNRDPRFYRDIVYMGAVLMGKEYNVAEGSSDALVNSTVRDTRSTRTGYALRKFIQNDWSINASISSMHFPLIRLPELMLIYAEALNETDGDVNTIKSMLNQIRERSFMKPVPPEFDSDKKLRREYIDRERRVELFFENNRYFTLRYKGIMTNPIEESKEQDYLAMPEETRAQQWFDEKKEQYPQTQHYIHGMQPVLDENGAIKVGGKSYRMERFEGKQLAPRRVTYRDYFFPINSNEIAKTPSLKQNPGW